MSSDAQGMWITGTGELGKLGSARAAPSRGIRHLCGDEDEPRLGQDIGPWLMVSTNQTVSMDSQGNGRRQCVQSASPDFIDSGKKLLQT